MADHLAPSIFVYGALLVTVVALADRQSAQTVYDAIAHVAGIAWVVVVDHPEIAVTISVVLLVRYLMYCVYSCYSAGNVDPNRRAAQRVINERPFIDISLEAQPDKVVIPAIPARAAVKGYYDRNRRYVPGVPAQVAVPAVTAPVPPKSVWRNANAPTPCNQALRDGIIADSHYRRQIPVTMPFGTIRAGPRAGETVPPSSAFVRWMAQYVLGPEAAHEQGYVPADVLLHDTHPPAVKQMVDWFKAWKGPDYPDTPANRQYIRAAMFKHYEDVNIRLFNGDHRHTHMRHDVDLAVELFFLQDDETLALKALFRGETWRKAPVPPQ